MTEADKVFQRIQDDGIKKTDVKKRSRKELEKNERSVDYRSNVP